MTVRIERIARVISVARTASRRDQVRVHGHHDDAAPRVVHEPLLNEDDLAREADRDPSE